MKTTTTMIVSAVAAAVALAFATGLITRRPPFRPPQPKYHVGDICDDGTVYGSVIYLYPTNLHEAPEWIATNPALREKIEKREALRINNLGWVAVGLD